MSKKNTLLQSIQQKLGGKRISGSLVTLSSAAIFAVYAAGYEQTKAAADRIAEQSNERMTGVGVAAPFVEPTVLNSTLSTSLAPTASAGSGAASTERSPLHVTSASAAVTNEPAAPQPAEDALAPSLKPAEAAPVGEAIAVVNETPATGLSAAAVPALVPVPVAIAAPPPPPPAPVVRQSLYRDGTYDGWGTSRHGNLQVAVVIQDGRIASAAIVQCLTRYPCSWIAQLPGQIDNRQSPTVDYVSGATQSVNAYYGAVVEALAKAK